jgi:hypothetical protein
MKKIRTFILGVFLLFLGCTLLGILYFIASKYWDFFNDPGWKSFGNAIYRVEGGNMWYLLGVATPFVGGAVACFIKLWNLWEDYIAGRVFFSLVILIAGLAIGFFWIIGFPTVFDNLDGNILGLLGYIIIPSWIAFQLLSCGIGLLKRK